MAQLRAQVWPGVVGKDPDRASLRLATRAAIAQPLVLALGILVLGNVQLTLFAAFGVFALVVLGNFGGDRRGRLGAYVGTALAGAVLVAAGTLASGAVWAAVLAILVVVFTVNMAGAFGGYVAGAQTPLLLAAVLAASVPAPASAVPLRVSGWLLGGAVATAAALLLWPHYERDALRQAAAVALRNLARLVSATRHDPSGGKQRAIAERATKALRTAYAETPYRPGGPSRRDRALAQLVTQVDRILYFTPAAADQPTSRNPSLEEGDELARAVVSVLEASAAALEGGPLPDLQGLGAARIAHRRALDAWAASQLAAGASAVAVLEGLDYDHRVRVLSYLALAAGANAAIASGRQPDREGVRIPYETPLDGGLWPAFRRAGRTLRAHLTWTSPLLHNSLRASLGLGIGVLVALQYGLAHGFWVVLGTMSVLRSNALATGRSAIEAVAGTLVGFAIGGLFTLVFARNAIVLWAALPVAVFLAGYAPSAVSFVAGQAAFTVLMLVLFNLLSPAGWQIGLVRIEDLLIGAALAVAAGTLLWPHGARAEFAAALSRLYRKAAVHLAEAFDLALGRGTMAAVAATRAEVQQARERAAESFDQLLREKNAQGLSPGIAASLLAAGDHAVIVADTFQVLYEMGYVAAACGSATETVSGQAAALVASWFMLAERVDGSRGVRTVPLHPTKLRAAALECLRAWGGESVEGGRAAIALAWTREWLEQLGTLVVTLEEPAAEVAASASAPWWR
ncbi:MAG TPA: FUSC family protein [Candidatus Dormibacteraeota bacterium]